MSGTTPPVCIVLLNLNGIHDTLECLRSLRSLRYPDFEVVVCDNGSTDDSWNQLLAWAAQNRGSFPSVVQAFSSPPIVTRPTRGSASGRLTLVENGANLGFGAGSNVGIRYALEHTAAQYIWLLNNDTVVDGDALTALVTRASSDPRIGIVGSTLLYYDNRSMVNALGGARFRRWRCGGEHIGAGTAYTPPVDRDAVERCMDYVHGASMLVSRRFVEAVGLLNEDYFLYFEEADWAERARRRFLTAYAPDSIVFHREGATIGSSSLRRPALLSLYFLTLNMPRFCRRYHPLWLPVLYAYLAYSVVKRLMGGHAAEVRVMLAAILGQPTSAFVDPRVRRAP